MGGSTKQELSTAELAKQIIDAIFPTFTYQDHRNNLLNFDKNNTPYLGSDINIKIINHFENQRITKHNQKKLELTEAAYKNQLEADQKEENNDNKEQLADENELSAIPKKREDITNNTNILLDEKRDLMNRIASSNQQINNNNCEYQITLEHRNFIQTLINNQITYQNINHTHAGSHSHSHSESHHHNHNHTHGDSHSHGNSHRHGNPPSQHNHHHSHGGSQSNTTHHSGSHNHNNSHNHSHSHSHAHSHHNHPFYSLYQNLTMIHLTHKLSEFNSKLNDIERLNKNHSNTISTYETKINEIDKTLSLYKVELNQMTSFSENTIPLRNKTRRERQDERAKRKNARIEGRIEQLSVENTKRLNGLILMDDNEGKKESQQLANQTIAHAYPIYKDRVKTILENKDTTSLTPEQKISLSNTLLVLEEHEKALQQKAKLNSELSGLKNSLCQQGGIKADNENAILELSNSIKSVTDDNQRFITQNNELEQKITRFGRIKKVVFSLYLLIVIALLASPIMIPINTLGLIGLLTTIVLVTTVSVLWNRENSCSSQIKGNNTRIKDNIYDIAMGEKLIETKRASIETTDVEISGIQSRIDALNSDIKSCEANLLQLQERAKMEFFETIAPSSMQQNYPNNHTIFQDAPPPHLQSPYNTQNMQQYN